MDGLLVYAILKKYIDSSISGVESTVPAKVSDITNDLGFQTEDDVNQAIIDAIGDAAGISLNGYWSKSEIEVATDEEVEEYFETE